MPSQPAASVAHSGEEEEEKLSNVRVERVPATDAARCRWLDGRSAEKASSGPTLLSVRMSPPPSPVFPKLPLVQTPRTKRSVIDAELDGLWAARSYGEFAAADRYEDSNSK